MGLQLAPLKISIIAFTISEPHPFFDNPLRKRQIFLTFLKVSVPWWIRIFPLSKCPNSKKKNWLFSFIWLIKS